ncbi:MAG: ABC transporter ATP-binding protein [Acidobacteriota bacterium]
MTLLQAADIKKTFKTRQGPVEAVRGVSLNLQGGEILGFLGPNGAGKTTTIKMVAGLIRPDSGSILINDENPHEDAWVLRKVGAVLEGNRNIYFRLTALENVEYFGVLKGMSAKRARRRGTELLEKFGLGDRMKTPVLQFSRGMQQKVALAVALVHDPPLLLMDEPSLGLDVEAAETVKGLIRQSAAEGRAILLTTHQMGTAEELSDRLAIIRDGRLVVEEATQDLMGRFTGEAYSIEIGGEVDTGRKDELEKHGAWMDNGKVGYLGKPDGLYRVLDLLKPLPLLRIQRDQEDLTGVFMSLIRGEADA